MVMKDIVWNKKALRQLRKIKSKQEKKLIYFAVQTLVDFPECDNVVKVKTTDFYRLKVDRWRVFSTENLEVISVEEVRKRNERTYK